MWCTCNEVHHLNVYCEPFYGHVVVNDNNIGTGYLYRKRMS